MALEPFHLDLLKDNTTAPTTAIFAESTPVPIGKLFVVEHISGYFVVGNEYPVDEIYAYDGSGQEVYLPTHFVSRELNFGGAFGVGRINQFGSPVKMYVSSERKITIRGDANSAGLIKASVIGNLVPM